MVQVPMPMEWFIGFTATIAILLVMVMVLAWYTPAMKFLYAKMLNKAIILLATRTGKLKFVIGDYKTGSGTVETKNHGDYYMLPAAKYVMNGAVTALAFEDFGISLTKEHIVGSNLLRMDGVEPKQIVQDDEDGNPTVAGSLEDADISLEGGDGSGG